MECPSFRMAAGRTWLEKAQNACIACGDCKGNFPIDPDKASEPEAIQEIIQHIRDIYLNDKAGCKYDLAKAGYIEGSLFVAYSNAVIEVHDNFDRRMQSFLKGWMKA